MIIKPVFKRLEMYAKYYDISLHVGFWLKCFKIVIGFNSLTSVWGRYIMKLKILYVSDTWWNPFKIIVKSFMNYVREIFTNNWGFTQMCKILVLLEGFEQSSRLKKKSGWEEEMLLVSLKIYYLMKTFLLLGNAT